VYYYQQEKIIRNLIKRSDKKMSHKPAGCFKTFKDYLNQQELDDYDLSESKQDKDKYNKRFQETDFIAKIKDRI